MRPAKKVELTSSGYDGNGYVDVVIPIGKLPMTTVSTFRVDLNILATKMNEQTRDLGYGPLLIVSVEPTVHPVIKVQVAHVPLEDLAGLIEKAMNTDSMKKGSGYNEGFVCDTSKIEHLYLKEKLRHR